MVKLAPGAFGHAIGFVLTAFGLVLLLIAPISGHLFRCAWTGAVATLAGVLLFMFSSWVAGE